MLETLGCSWEGSNISKLISVDVPAEVDYFPIKMFLEEGEKKEQWSYEEACLEHHV